MPTNISFTVLKIFSIAFLCSCLMLLTSINFFKYPPSDCHISYHQNEDQSPLEEKSPSTSSTVIQEEFLHHHTCIPPVYYDVVSTEYIISAAEQLPVIHFELISPPPKSTI